ncbi:MAG: hypothetical protein KME64_41305 [Scytonematopsis contorta HA4267-MV1]|jgi:hypothetical protein|nr:hypothetical protein [Scytonematopsis contorta HA4267-MV1]
MYLAEIDDKSELKTNKYGYVEFEFNTKIDFAIWVLTKSNIHISPFNYHNTSNNQYLNKSDWTNFFQSIIIAQDPRWLCKTEDIEKQVKSEIASLRPIFPLNKLTDSNLHILRHKIKDRLSWLNQQYEFVKNKYQEQPNILIPNELTQMWSEYQSSSHTNHNIQKIMDDKNLCPVSDNLDSIHKIYLVNYPTVVEYKYEINTVIGVPNEDNFNAVIR